MASCENGWEMETYGHLELLEHLYPTEDGWSISAVSLFFHAVS